MNINIPQLINFKIWFLLSSNIPWFKGSQENETSGYFTCKSFCEKLIQNYQYLHGSDITLYGKGTVICISISQNQFCTQRRPKNSITT